MTPTAHTSQSADEAARSATPGAPILLFGMPRSGTTWLGKIFDSHPATLYRHEPDSFGRLNFMPIAPSASEGQCHRDQIQAFVDSLPSMRDTKVAATLPMFRKDYLNPMQSAWNAAAIRLAKLQARRSGEAKAHLWIPEGNPQRYRTAWKSIESVARMGAIVEAIPDATGVLIIRHPCGYVGSVVRGKRLRSFTDGDSIGEDLGLLSELVRTSAAKTHGVTIEQLRSSSPLERLVWQWVLCNETAIAETGPSGRVMSIRYEDLCRDPVGESRKLLEWTGLDFPAQTKAFLSTSTTRHKDRYYSVFKNPEKAANSWREELPAEVIQRIKDIVARTEIGERFLADF